MQQKLQILAVEAPVKVKLKVKWMLNLSLKQIHQVIRNLRYLPVYISVIWWSLCQGFIHFEKGEPLKWNRYPRPPPCFCFFLLLTCYSSQWKIRTVKPCFPFCCCRTPWMHQKWAPGAFGDLCERKAQATQAPFPPSWAFHGDLQQHREVWSTEGQKSVFKPDFSINDHTFQITEHQG